MDLITEGRAMGDSSRQLGAHLSRVVLPTVLPALCREAFAVTG